MAMQGSETSNGAPPASQCPAALRCAAAHDPAPPRVTGLGNGAPAESASPPTPFVFVRNYSDGDLDRGCVLQRQKSGGSTVMVHERRTLGDVVQPDKLESVSRTASAAADAGAFPLPRRMVSQAVVARVALATPGHRI
jgi:hypothetical protein